MDYQADQHGRSGVPPVRQLTEYVGIYGDGTGGTWYLIASPSIAAARDKFPMLDVREVRDAPAVEAMELDRLRAFVLPSEDPMRPVQDRPRDRQREFGKFRAHLLDAARQRLANLELLGPSPLPEPPPARWVATDNCDELLQYLRALPPSSGRE